MRSPMCIDHELFVETLVERIGNIRVPGGAPALGGRRLAECFLDCAASLTVLKDYLFLAGRASAQFSKSLALSKSSKIRHQLVSIYCNSKTRCRFVGEQPKYARAYIMGTYIYVLSKITITLCLRVCLYMDFLLVRIFIPNSITTARN